MFDAIARLFSRPDAAALALEPRLAVAALLVHLAAVDGAVKSEERKALKGALKDFYELSEDEVEKPFLEPRLECPERQDRGHRRRERHHHQPDLRATFGIDADVAHDERRHRTEAR